MDSDGIGHLISVDDIDLNTAQDLRIPVVIRFVEPNPDGTDRKENGYLVYGNSHFKGFLRSGGASPMISLNNSAFNGATVQTVAVMPVSIMGISFSFVEELGEAFTLPMEPDRDRGMKLVMTPIAEIRDLEGRELITSAVVTDIYGCVHDISPAVQAAKEGAEAGTLAYSIAGAEITVPNAVFNRRRQEPDVTVKIGGTVLTRDEDYEVVAEPMLKAGTEEITLFGMGDYVGYAKATFTVEPAESAVEAMEAVSASDLMNGNLTVLTVKTGAHPDNVTFDFSNTDETLRPFLRAGLDGKTVELTKGAEAGTYQIVVHVVGGSADTYSDIDGAAFTVEVK